MRWARKSRRRRHTPRRNRLQPRLIELSTIPRPAEGGVKFSCHTGDPVVLSLKILGGITMKIAYLAAVSAIILGASSGFAAPSESVESAGASTAYQKVDAMFGEQMVAQRLQTVGLTAQQARARLSQLSDQQLGQLA